MMNIRSWSFIVLYIFHRTVIIIFHRTVIIMLLWECFVSSWLFKVLMPSNRSTIYPLPPPPFPQLAANSVSASFLKLMILLFTWTLSELFKYFNIPIKAYLTFTVHLFRIEMSAWYYASFRAYFFFENEVTNTCQLYK